MIGHWNHRILFNGEQYWVSEVYYDESGKPWAFTGPDSCPVSGWDTLDDLVKTVRHIQRATLSPVLTVKDDKIVGEVKTEWE